MKLLLVTATAIAVFTVDCQDFSNDPEAPDTANNLQLSFEEFEGQAEAQLVLDGNTFAENQDADINDLQMKKVERVHHQKKLRRSKCKSRNACVVMGGFCVTNATLCSGRLVPEGCKGTNCQCCVPGNDDKENIQNLLNDLESMKYNLTQANLNLKLELQAVRDNQNNISETDTEYKNLILTKMENITDGSKHLKIELQSIKEYQNNITNADKELKMEFNVFMENITNGDLQLKEDLQYIIDHQNNITDTDTSLKLELEAVMKNITDSNSLIKTDMNTMKNNMNSHNSNIVSKLNSIGSKLDTIEAVQITGHLAHFPYATHKKSWADAKAFCESIGGQIWTPLNKAETVAAFKACGIHCWNGWHKNSGGQWVTGTGQVKNSNFWESGEPQSFDDAAWSSETGIWGRIKTSLYGWTCQM